MHAYSVTVFYAHRERRHAWSKRRTDAFETRRFYRLQSMYATLSSNRRLEADPVAFHVLVGNATAVQNWRWHAPLFSPVDVRQADRLRE